MRQAILCILVLASIVAANQAEYMFQQGVDAYQQNDYQAAIEHFESALQHGQESAALYFNLANAYYKMDNVGKAILNYERAKNLAPSDEDVNFNLQVAELQVVDKISSPETDFFFTMWNGLVNLLSLKQFAILSIILYLLLMSLVILRLVSRNIKLITLFRYGWLPLFILFIFFGSLFVLRVRQDMNVKHGVILVDKVSVVSSPAADSTEMFALHEGVKFQIIAQSGDYIRIRLTDGKDGWVPRAALEII